MKLPKIFFISPKRSLLCVKSIPRDNRDAGSFYPQRGLKLTVLSAQTDPEYSLIAVVNFWVDKCIETAKENGLNPYEYPKYVFQMLPNVDIANLAFIDELLPHSASLPAASCRIKI